jgi:2-dehydro-3-deoxyphosphogluconate aldolase/(4S)-4-hydroxy-2-oxoglutarate aldolase
MAGPFPDVRFVATGGVSASNAPDYLDAGAIAVGISLRDDPLPVLADLQTRGLLTR